MHKTESIALFNTGLKGPIPDLSNLKSLEVFKVENCNLEGNAWKSVLNTPTLKVLGVAGNELVTGTLNGVENLVNLEELYTGATGIGGQIPEDIGQLTKLWNFRSPETALTGALPESMGDLVSLMELDLGENQLDGNLPESVGNWEKITDVLLYSNCK